jgi:hypothetical protein
MEGHGLTQNVVLAVVGCLRAKMRKNLEECRLWRARKSKNSEFGAPNSRFSRIFSTLAIYYPLGAPKSNGRMWAAARSAVECANSRLPSSKTERRWDDEPSQLHIEQCRFFSDGSRLLHRFDLTGLSYIRCGSLPASRFPAFRLHRCRTSGGRNRCAISSGL